MTDQTVTLRFVGDNKSAVAASKETKDAITDIGKAAETAGKQGATSFEELSARARNLSADLKAGKISQAEYTAGQSELANVAARMNTQLLTNRANLSTLSSTLKNVAGNLHDVSLQGGAAQRELGVMAGELLRGNFSAFERSLVTLSRQTGLLSQALGFLVSPLGLILALGAAIAGVFVSAEHELDGYNRGIVLTGNYSGKTAEEMRDLAAQVGEATGKYSKSSEAMTALATTGRYAGDQLGRATKAAVEFGEMTSQKTEKVVEQFDKLAESPTKFVDSLNQQMHFLTASQLEEIATMEEMGNKAGAVAKAQELVFNMLDERYPEYKEKQGWIAKGWDDVKSSIDGAYTSLKTFLSHPVDSATSLFQPIKDAFSWLNNIKGSGAAAPYVIAAGPQSSLPDKALAEAADAAGQAKKREQQAVEDFAASFAVANAKELAGLEQANATYGKGKLGLAQYETEKQLLAAAAKFSGDALVQETNKILDQRMPIEDLAKKQDALVASKKRHHDTTEELYSAMSRLDSLLAQEQGLMGGPVDAAWAKYNKLVIDSNKAARDAFLAGGDVNKIIKEQNQILEAGAAARDKAVQAAIDESDILGSIEEKYRLENNALLENAQTHAEATEIARAETKAREEFAKGMRETPELYDYEVQGILKAVRAHSQLTAEVQKDLEAQREWQGIVGNSLDTFGNGVAKVASDAMFHFKSIGQTFKDLGSMLTDTAAQTVQAMIAYFFRLSAINPLLQSIFGSSWIGGALPTMANAFGGTPALVQTGGQVASMAGGGTSGAAGAAGGGFDWTSGASWLQAGKTIWQGFSNGLSSLWNGPQTPGITSMTQDANGIYRAAYGNVSPGVDMSNGGYSSGFTQALGIAGGIYAGYNRAQDADGAFGKVGGGLAYGVGTYYAGAAVSAALAGGVSAGLAAVPVVGWIALAAMLVDKFSGGKLFGSSYHPESATGAINISDAGGSASASVTEVKQQSLFRGRKWRTSDVDPGDDARDAATQFFTAIKQAMTAAANAMGAELAPVIDASIRTVTEYDKNGRVTATKYYVDALGRTWEEASSELAAKRVQAEAIIKQADVSANGAASALAEQFRKDAEQLFDASQFIVAAQADINKHQALLGDSATLAATLDITKSLQQADETLVQTYARLQTETSALRDSLALTGADIGKTGAAFVSFADEAAIAAGGVDSLTSLTQSFAQTFYTAQELAQQQVENLAKARDAALSSLGIDAGTTRDQFRALYEAALPTMTAQQLVQWQQAGVLLGQAADAQKAYNDQIAQNAATVKSILAQLNPDGDPNAGTLQSSLDAVNAQYDDAIAKLKEAGATTEQLAQAEMYRAQAAAKTKDAAQQAYDDLVAQIEDGFRDLISPMSDTSKAIDAIGKAEQDTIDQLNAAAKAAGMQGAAEKDLAKVHQYAAAQVQQVIAQLRSATIAAGQQGGYIDSIDGLNQQIQALESSISGASNSFSSAADSVSNAAESLSDKMKLMLGDLSPYSDEKKLQIAMQGLQNGTASREDVLQIGRRLYSSTEQYTALYDKVMGMPDLSTQQATGGSYNSGPSVDVSAVQRQIDELTKKRDEMQADATKSAALAFAQQLADDAQAHGITSAEELSALNVNIDKLSKDLGVNSDSLADYIESFKRESIPDSIKENTDRLIAAIGLIGKVDNTPVTHSIDPVTVTIQPDPVAVTTNAKISDLIDKIVVLSDRVDSLTTAQTAQQVKQTSILEGIEANTSDNAAAAADTVRTIGDLTRRLMQTA